MKDSEKGAIQTKEGKYILVNLVDGVLYELFNDHH